MALTKDQKEGIKWAVWLGTILFVVVFHFVDEAKEKATTDVTMTNQDEKLDEILKKVSDHEKYWLEQMEFNGSVNAYFRLDIE